jgi:hypothetical protein
MSEWQHGQPKESPAEAGLSWWLNGVSRPSLSAPVILGPPKWGLFFALGRASFARTLRRGERLTWDATAVEAFDPEFSASLLNSFRVAHFLHGAGARRLSDIALVNLAFGDRRTRVGGESSRWR